MIIDKHIFCISIFSCTTKSFLQNQTFFCIYIFKTGILTFLIALENHLFKVSGQNCLTKKSYLAFCVFAPDL